MSIQGLLAKIILLAFATSVLMACGSAGRNASPDYHINAMERMDKHAHYPVDERTKRMPKDWNKDK